MNKLIFSILLVSVLAVMTSSLAHQITYVEAKKPSEKKTLKKINKDLKKIPGKVYDIDSILAFEGDKIYTIYGEEIELPQLTEICDDGLDNDLDGLIDENCNIPPVKEEICGDGIDNDLDGLVDENCPPVPVNEICNDGIDNDLDGLVDEGCEVVPPVEEICGDGIDNNNNGSIDENCPEPINEICGDGIDNDLDGLVDEGCPVIPPTNGTWTFVTFGDTIDITQKVCDAAAKENPELLLHAGDYYPDKVSESSFKSDCAALVNNPNIKAVNAEGNHEKGQGDKVINAGFDNPTGTGKTGFVLEHRNLNVLVANTNYWGDGNYEQLATNVFQKSQQDGEFATLLTHFPAYNPIGKDADHKSYDLLMNDLAPIFNEFNVEFTLAGHAHNAVVYNPMDCTKVDTCTQAPDGTRHLVVGSANGDRTDAANGEDSNIEFFTETNGYTVGKVSKDKIDMEFKDLNGKVLYSYVIPNLN